MADGKEEGYEPQRQATKPRRVVRKIKTARDLGQETRERSLSGTYLSQAAEHLRRAGSPDALYPAFYIEADDPSDIQRGFAVSHAIDARLQECRSSVLFSALAAEAYVNEFLAVYIKGKDYDAVERMSTVNKYVLGTRLATGRQLFKRDMEPAKTLKALFDLRHKLVHPQPGYGGPRRYDESLPLHDPEYNPGSAARYLLYVASAAVILVRRAFPDVPDIPADLLWHGREIRRHRSFPRILARQAG